MSPSLFVQWCDMWQCVSDMGSDIFGYRLFPYVTLSMIFFIQISIIKKIILILLVLSLYK